MSFDNALAPGRYALSTVVARRGSGDAVIDRWENLATIVVTGVRAGGGLVDLEHEMRRGARMSAVGTARPLPSR